jgi:hypothetical protein
MYIYAQLIQNVMDGSKKSDMSIPQQRSSDLVVPGADVRLDLLAVYNIFLNFMRSLLSNEALKISFRYVPMFLGQCIVIDSSSDILSNIHIEGCGDIRLIKLFGYYDGNGYVPSKLASIHFFDTGDANEKIIEGSKSTLIQELQEQIKRKESTSSKSPSDISELIGLLRDIKERCDEAIEKHGRG